jgi:hypothetical protein
LISAASIKAGRIVDTSQTRFCTFCVELWKEYDRNFKAEAVREVLYGKHVEKKNGLGRWRLTLLVNGIAAIYCIIVCRHFVPFKP